jgi:hypothetical protein
MTAAVADPLATTEDWLVCLNQLRTVRDGQVACPCLDGMSVPAIVCADCRHLSARREERGRERSCSTEPIPRARLEP